MPSYRLYDPNGIEVTPRDLQNKSWWHHHGVDKENAFVNKYGDLLQVIINPLKESDPQVPDLYRLQFEKLAELKTQNCPFFQAQSRFNLDPQYTVVFNLKDELLYSSQYPEIDIYFWVDWHAVKFENRHSNITVNQMTGVWLISFSDLSLLCKEAPVHSYGQRRDDTRGNAKSSYVLNLLDPQFTQVA